VLVGSGDGVKVGVTVGGIGVKVCVGANVVTAVDRVPHADIKKQKAIMATR